MTDAIDLRLDGHVLVRLLDPTPADRAAVERRLGLQGVPASATHPAQPGPAGGGDPAPPGPAGAGEPAVASDAPGEPELTLRYVDDLPLHGPLRTVGRDDGAFTDDAFVIRRGRRPIAIVPLERIGQPGAELMVLRGSGAPARLVSLVNLGLLGHGRIALHAAAVECDGRGIAACGWSGSGKTEVLLGYVARGARVVGDEWIHATPATGRLVGLPEPVRVQDWHLAQVPELADRIGRRARLAMRGAAVVERLSRTVGTAARPVPGSGLLRAGAGRAAGRRHRDIAPERLLPADRRAAATSLDVLYLLETGLDPAIRVEPIDPARVAARMALAHVHHRRALLDWYWQARYAFPDRTNPLLERIEAVERDRLETLFASRPAFRVDHPHAVDVRALVDAMEARR